MTEANFIQALKDAGICSAKIYPVKARDNDQFPYCVYTIIRNALSQKLERSKDKRNRYVFTSWHTSYQEAVDTLELFDETIGTQQLGYSVSGAIIDRDPDKPDIWRLTNNDWSIIEI